MTATATATKPATFASVGKLTAKDTGKIYDVYSMQGETDTYCLYALRGTVCYCSCKTRKYRPYKACKHMTSLQLALTLAQAERRAAREQAEIRTSQAQAEKRERAPLSSNRAFSLMA